MNSKTLKKACLILAGAVLALGLTIRVTEQRHWLSLLPSSLQVSTILYVEEASGKAVVLYELPEGTARQIQERGIGVLNDASTWNATPEGAVGFGIPTNPRVTKPIEQALAAPGSYITRTATGTLILMPSERRVAYVYAG